MKNKCKINSCFQVHKILDTLCPMKKNVYPVRKVLNDASVIPPP